MAENLAVGTLVGSFGTQDPDAGNTFTYALVAGSGGTDNGSFSIGGSNLLTAAAFNYEVQSDYSIRVQSMDQGGLSTQKVFAIHVADVVENPPVFSGLDMPSGTNVVLSWAILANHTYSIYFSTNLPDGFVLLQSNYGGASYTDSLSTLRQKYWKITTDP